MDFILEDFLKGILQVPLNSLFCLCHNFNLNRITSYSFAIFLTGDLYQFFNGVEVATTAHLLRHQVCVPPPQASGIIPLKTLPKVWFFSLFLFWKRKRERWFYGWSLFVSCLKLVFRLEKNSFFNYMNYLFAYERETLKI